MEAILIPDTIRTFTGRNLNVFAPDPEMIDIEDIAHALSLQCRFGGHVTEFYSVAQHSVMCSDMILTHSEELGISPENENSAAFEALMHDASEAYLIDLPKPIKNKLEDYKRVEDDMMRLISNKFCFDYPLNDYVKFVDNQMFQIEWGALMLNKSDVIGLQCWTPENAKTIFLQTFDTLYTYK